MTGTDPGMIVSLEGSNLSSSNSLYPNTTEAVQQALQGKASIFAYWSTLRETTFSTLSDAARQELGSRRQSTHIIPGIATVLMAATTGSNTLAMTAAQGVGEVPSVNEEHYMIRLGTGAMG